METGGLFMKSEFHQMTIKELKQFVLTHRQDQEAFQALMKRVDEQPQQQIYGEVDAAEFRELVQKLRHSQTEEET